MTIDLNALLALAQTDPEYCLLWIDWWPMCMKKAEWAGWFQAVFSILAIAVGALGIWWQLRHNRRTIQRTELERELQRIGELQSLMSRCKAQLESVAENFDDPCRLEDLSDNRVQLDGLRALLRVFETAERTVTKISELESLECARDAVRLAADVLQIAIEQFNIDGGATLRNQAGRHRIRIEGCIRTAALSAVPFDVQADIAAQKLDLVGGAFMPELQRSSVDAIGEKALKRFRLYSDNRPASEA